MQASSVSDLYYQQITSASQSCCDAQATTGYGALYIVMLAIDVVTSLLHSLSGILDRCADVPAAAHGAPAAKPDPTPHSIPSAERTASPELSHTLRLLPRKPPGSPSALSAPSVASPLAAPALGGAGRAAVAPPTGPGEDAGGAGEVVAETAEVVAEGGAGVGAPQEVRMSTTYASQVAMERLWPLLPPPTHETCRLLAGILWQPSLEVLPPPMICHGCHLLPLMRLPLRPC